MSRFVNSLTRRLVPALVVIALTNGLCPAVGDAALFFLFQPSTAHVGDTVVVRTGGTPRSFTLSDRAGPRLKPISLYLVRNDVADQVSSRHDSRLVRVGALVPDKNGHGILSFRVPALRPGRYAAVAYCPGCARFSRGRAFLALKVDEQEVVPRYRRLLLLQVVPSRSSSSTWLVAGGVPALAMALGAGTVLLRGRNSSGPSVSQ
jgi:hypothetical protein